MVINKLNKTKRSEIFLVVLLKDKKRSVSRVNNQIYYKFSTSFSRMDKNSKKKTVLNQS